MDKNDKNKLIKINVKYLNDTINKINCLEYFILYLTIGHSSINCSTH